MRARFEKFVVFACATIAISLQMVACQREPTKEQATTSGPSATARSNPQPPLAIHYSAVKVKRGANGQPISEKYDGKIAVIDATVTEVHLKNKSSSIAIENDVAYFLVDSEQPIPRHPEVHAIKLNFDQYGLSHAQRFIKGEKWKFTFTEGGTLVFMEPKSAN